jgi:catechol 2,3-dioxygenase-like lactoylglutathione lyase family enzyme
MSDEKAAITGTGFVLAVPDVARTAAWWVEVMGFEPWMEPHGWRFVRRGACRIMLGECPDAILPAYLGDHQYFGYVYVDDLDAYHAEIAAKDADIIAPPEDKPWGMREMAVRTPDGHRVMFGQALEN